jgi:signal recognition particle subunit SEC65
MCSCLFLTAKAARMLKYKYVRPTKVPPRFQLETKFCVAVESKGLTGKSEAAAAYPASSYGVLVDGEM